MTKSKAKMASKAPQGDSRSKVAQACLDFGSHLLQVRLSSLTSTDAQEAVKDLFHWFEEHDAFSEENSGIAIHAISFGEDLLESRKTATVDEATDAIHSLYSDLTS